jgi:quinol-cytochrome oxidoreductase complex cytochrome b subunit
MKQPYYLLYFMSLYTILILLVYILIYNQIQQESFTSNTRYTRNTLYGSYKRTVHRVGDVLKSLRLY